jgi:hypothetical protein
MNSLLHAIASSTVTLYPILPELDEIDVLMMEKDNMQAMTQHKNSFFKQNRKQSTIREITLVNNKHHPHHTEKKSMVLGI